MDRWILRIVTNTEAAVGMLRRGEVNFLSDYRGDPKILDRYRQAAEGDVRFAAPSRSRAACA